MSRRRGGVDRSRRRFRPRWICALLAIAPAACASDLGGQDSDGGVDGCSLQILGSGALDVGATESYQVEFVVDGLTGARVATWSASLGDAPVPLLEVDDGVFAVELTPAQPGVHTLRVSGSVGGVACLGTSRSINAVATNAAWETFRLWVEPPVAPPAPQEIMITVPGLSDYELGDLSLEPGTQVVGTLSAGGPGFGGFLRASRVDVERSAPREAFATDEGYTLWVEDGSYSLLIVPDDDAVAPMKVVGSTSDIGGDMDLTGSITIGGTVTGPDGSPLQGASVGFTTNGVPTQTGVTGADGRFEVSARPGAELSVAVAPPPGSGLPNLEVEEVVTAISDGTEVDIAYDDGLVVTAASLTLRDSGGAPAPGAGAVWLSDVIAGAGSVAIDGGSPDAMAGRVRVGVTADGAGTVSLPLTRATYQVLIAPVGAVPGVVEAVVDASPPTSLTAPQPATVSGALVGASGPVAGARVAASTTGSFAAAAGGATTTTDSDGSFSLQVTGSLPMVLRATPPPGVTVADTRSAHTAPAGGDALVLGSVVAPAAIRVTGRLTVPGLGDLARARVTLRCGDCGSEAPLAAAETDPAGRFLLRVADPGEQ